VRGWKAAWVVQHPQGEFTLDVIAFAATAQMQHLNPVL